MKNRFAARALCVVLVITMLFTAALPVAAESVTYTLDIGDVEDVPQYSKADGDTLKCGTDNYFTIFFSNKTRIENNSKDFSDGFEARKRLNFGASTAIEEPILNAVQIKTSGPATVKIWWVSGGNDREVGIYDPAGNVLVQSQEGSVKNLLYISEFSLDAAGTYYIGNIGGNNNYYKLEVTEDSSASTDKPARSDWSAVAAPAITGASDTGDGEITVTVDANVGYDGGDEVVVTMFDASGNEVARRSSVLEKTQHTLRFNPEASGTYTFQAVLNREGETGKEATGKLTADFALPLAEPSLISATSKGGGTVEVVWTAVPEAESYEILSGDTVLDTADGTTHVVSSLTVGQVYTLRVAAVRGNDRSYSSELSVTVTEGATQTWGFTAYGPSTNADNNGYVGSVNEDGYVTVYSEGGKGKIVPASTDGLAFYYTAVPTDHNFTLRAKITVDSWTYSNGQEGFGLMAADRLGTSGDTSAFWNNQIMALATKIEYRYDPDTLEVNDLNGSGTKYSMKLGLGTIAKTGVTKDNLAKLEANDTATINTQFLSRMTSLESGAGYWGKDSGTYNIIGNCANEAPEGIERAMLTEFILELQKNNSGYFITYYGEDGTVLAQQKYYGADILNPLDSDFVYVGFFAARNARATFSDVEFSTIPASEDAPAEDKPVTEIEPTVSVTSATITTSLDYTLAIDANVSGKVKITVEGEVIAEDEPVTGGVRFFKQISLKEYGENRIQVRFTPDETQDLGPDTVLSSTADVHLSTTVTCNKGMYHREVIYVSPEGLPNGAGTREYPFDIQTAVNNVVPGQTIVLMEGTYKLKTTLRIQRGMDGTEDAPIRMIADPEASARPVLDFQKECAGIVHGGDYWYFYGFDVTNSQDGQKGFQVSGNYNTLVDIHAYRNGNTGIQISRYSGTDLFADWPAHNLVLNCTSYYNADPGFEDADGFAAKLTVGEGNVFDGCVAYNNADDGWDLYAKVETGCIGAVTIRNCVAYNNGFLPDSTKTGNGNGFKLGGESLSGKHILENSYAFFNLSKGIDSNSCPDVIVRNCVSYNNGRYNVALYTNNAANTAYEAAGIISFKDSTSPHGNVSEGDNLKPKGTQDTDAFRGNTNYYWDGKAAVNASGEAVSGDMFVSLEFKGVARNADGTIDMQGFLEKTEKAPAHAGAEKGGMPSQTPEIPAETAQHTYSEAWYTEDAMFHWHECECGDKADMGEHDLVWILDKEATETETGRKHQQCQVCGYQKPAITVYYGEELETEPTAETTQPVSETPSEPVDEPAAGLSPAVIVVIVLAAAGAAAAFVFLRKKKG